MAWGTITATKVKNKPGMDGVQIYKLAFKGDSAYKTSGGTAFLASFQSATDSSLVIDMVTKAGACATYEPVYDTATGNLMLFKEDGTEVGDGDESGNDIAIQVLCH